MKEKISSVYASIILRERLESALHNEFALNGIKYDDSGVQKISEISKEICFKFAEEFEVEDENAETN